MFGWLKRALERRTYQRKLAALPALLGREAFDEAAKEAQALVDLAEEVFGKRAPEMTTPLYVLAAARLSLGDVEHALPPCLRAVSIAEAHAGTTTEPRLPKLYELAAVLHERTGNLDLAIALHRRLLAGHERMREPDERAIADLSSKLGLLLAKQEHFTEGELLLKRALQTRERLDGARSLLAAEALYNLGTVLAGAARAADASRDLRRALSILEDLDEPALPLLASVRHNLATIVEGLGKTAEAESLYRGALAARESAAGPDDEDLRPTLVRLGQILLKRGERDEALGLFDRALVLAERELGPEHPTTEGIRSFRASAAG